MTFRTNVKPIQLVAYLALTREEWPVMVGEWAVRLRDYPGVAVFDATGVGDVVADILKEEHASALPFLMVGKARSALLSNYIRAIEADLIVAPFIRSMETEHRLASVDDVYRPNQTNSHLPDSISAGALAWHAVRTLVNVDEWLRDLRDPSEMMRMAYGGQIMTLPTPVGDLTPEEYARQALEQARLLGLPGQVGISADQLFRQFNGQRRPMGPFGRPFRMK